MSDKMDYLRQFDDLEHFMRHTFADDVEGDPIATFRDIARYGINSGFSWFIYYNDVIPLYEVFVDDLWAMLRDYADAIGTHPLAALTMNTDIDDDTGLKNALVWFGAETIAHRIVDADEEGEDTE